MLKRYLATPFLFLVLGGICLSLSPAYNRFHTPQYVRSSASDDFYHSDSPRNQATGREEIVYMDERDMDMHHRANRMGDWSYKQNWRYDREAFYNGETQAEAYRKEHPSSMGGIGMDPDPEYIEMRKFYEQESNKRRQNANPNRSRFYGNRPFSQANQRNDPSYRRNYSHNPYSATNNGYVNDSYN